MNMEFEPTYDGYAINESQDLSKKKENTKGLNEQTRGVRHRKLLTSNKQTTEMSPTTKRANGK